MKTLVQEKHDVLPYQFKGLDHRDKGLDLSPLDLIIRRGHRPDLFLPLPVEGGNIH
jgi:hypothetical protein